MKDTVKSRRQATDGEEILTNRTNNKGLVSEITLKTNKQNITTQQKGGKSKRFEQTIHQRR